MKLHLCRECGSDWFECDHESRDTIVVADLHPAQVQEARRLLCGAVYQFCLGLKALDRSLLQDDSIIWSDHVDGRMCLREFRSAEKNCDRAAAVLGIKWEVD